MKKIMTTILIFVSIIVAGLFLIRMNKQETDVTKTKTKVGCILNGKINDHSWGESHYNGMEISAKELNLDVVYKEDIPEDERCVETIEELIAYGCKIIICDSFGYGEWELQCAKEEYINAGFSDYLSKPIEGMELEKMLMKYLPQDKISLSKASDVKPYINTELGLQYCMNSMEFYKEMLEMYCDEYEDCAAKLTEALKAEDWDIYTVTVHALKSTSLNIGGEQISKAAKELEAAGKALRASEQMGESRTFIMEHHDIAMQLYGATVEEAKKILIE